MSEDMYPQQCAHAASNHVCASPSSASSAVTKLTTVIRDHPTMHTLSPAPGSYVPPDPSQVGQNPNPKMPQVVAPEAGAIGFTPMLTPGVAPRPVIGSLQPASPPTQQATPTPAAAPPTVETADTSNNYTQNSTMMGLSDSPGCTGSYIDYVAGLTI
ncbi:unnamed protein product [Eruca vesicaria subsp. sativa]|uniref:Uncharacterized protein n=1 Tax=Eruca vesicaria subsp. sativa TaxID=29727 RepID=A0ABC8K936_ERUVS|nr:unnamed protein product [Eruca vesicaria subsp. sativa]